EAARRAEDLASPGLRQVLDITAQGQGAGRLLFGVGLAIDVDADGGPVVELAPEPLVRLVAAAMACGDADRGGDMDVHVGENARAHAPGANLVHVANAVDRQHRAPDAAEFLLVQPRGADLGPNRAPPGPGPPPD